jgi:hypothetical protein
MKSDFRELEMQLKEKIKKLAEPVDFDAFEKDGVLKKKGAWYLVLQYDKLPKHVTDRIVSIQADKQGRVTALKFSKPTKRLQKLSDKLNAE